MQLTHIICIWFFKIKMQLLLGYRLNLIVFLNRRIYRHYFVLFQSKTDYKRYIPGSGIRIREINITDIVSGILPCGFIPEAISRQLAIRAVHISVVTPFDNHVAGIDYLLWGSC